MKSSAASHPSVRRFLGPFQIVFFWALVPILCGQQPPGNEVQDVPDSTRASAVARTQTVLFIGNSFIYAAESPVRFYRAQSVTDLNGEGVGGVPALFKSFSEQEHIDFKVSLETIGGAGLDAHLERKARVIVRPWDHVVMHGFSLLDQSHPGDSHLLVDSTKKLSELLHQQNPNVDIWLIATWPRADQVYPALGHWHGKSVAVMARDIQAGYELAASSAPFIHGVIHVGAAWIRAMDGGIADPNPYDGIAFGQIDLWGYDHYHASTFGYYLEALMVFGDLTGIDPRSLGRRERCAFELGLSPEQTAALQKVAFDELSAEKGRSGLRAFIPTPTPVSPILGRSDTISRPDVR